MQGAIYASQLMAESLELEPQVVLYCLFIVSTGHI